MEIKIITQEGADLYIPLDEILVLNKALYVLIKDKNVHPEDKRVAKRMSEELFVAFGNIKESYTI